MLVFSKDFKEAIDGLPSKEKTKLLLRLIKKDEILFERLKFELISEDSAEYRRGQLKSELEDKVRTISKNMRTPKYLLKELRYLSGAITRHLKITKDKYGEVELLIFILTESLGQTREKFLKHSEFSNQKLNIYIVAKVFKILLLMEKMHEDDVYDFKEPLRELGLQMKDNPYLKSISEQQGLQLNWLLNDEIPENISEIYKELRANGYLR